MTDGGIIPSEEFNEQLKKYVRENMRREHSGNRTKGRWHKKGSGSGGGGGGGGCCSLHLYPDTVNTFLPSTNDQTRRRWKVSNACTKGDLSAIRKVISAVGTLVWPGGQPILELNVSTGVWEQDVTEDLVLYDNNGDDITETAATISGVWARTVDLALEDEVTLTMTATL